MCVGSSASVGSANASKRETDAELVRSEAKRSSRAASKAFFSDFSSSSTALPSFSAATFSLTVLASAPSPFSSSFVSSCTKHG